MNTEGSDHETGKVFSRWCFQRMSLLLATLNNSEWLTYLSCPGTAGESEKQESKEEAGGTEAITGLRRKSVGTGQPGLRTGMCHTLVEQSQDRSGRFFITEHHITAPSCG